MGKQFKDDPLGIKAALNGSDTAVAEPVQEQKDPLGILAALKKKEPTEKSLPSEGDSKELNSTDSGQPVDTGGKDLSKPSVGPISDLQRQIEEARQNNIEETQAKVLPDFGGIKQPTFDKLFPPKKGLKEIASDLINKDRIGQKESLDFLASQQKKLHESIAAIPKEASQVKSDQPADKTPLTSSELQANDQTAKDEQEKEDRSIEDTGLNRFSSGSGQFNKSLVNIATQLVRTLPIVAANTTGRLGLVDEFGKASDPKQDLVYKLADWIDKQADEYLTTNPKYKGEFFADTLPSTAATLMSFMVGGALGKTTTIADLAIPSASKAVLQQTAEHIPAAFMASATTASEEYENALKSGATPETAMKTWEKNLFTGLPFLVSPTIKAFDKLSGGAIKYGIAKAAEGGAVGMFQMGSMKFLENASAQSTYDKTRKLTEGVLGAGGSGFAVNAFLTGLLSAITHKAVGVTPAAKAKYEESIKLVEDKLNQTKDLGNTDYYQEPGLREESGMFHKSPAEVISDQKTNIKSTDDTAAIEKAAEVIQEKQNLTPQEGVKDDSTNKSGIQSSESGGQEPVQAEPEQGGSSQEAGGRRILSRSPEGKGKEVEPATEKVFVYGTLQDQATRRKALGLHGEAVKTEPASAKGDVTDENKYPDFHPEGQGKVEGQVLSLTGDQVKKLDKWEEKYDRKEVTLDNGEKAWVYEEKPAEEAKNALKDEVTQRTPEESQTILKKPIPKEGRSRTIKIKSVDPETGETTHIEMEAGAAHLKMRRQYKNLEKIVNCLHL